MVGLYTYTIGNHLLGGVGVEMAIRDFLLPKLAAAEIDIMAEGNKHLYLSFMRSLKAAKERLSTFASVCT